MTWMATHRSDESLRCVYCTHEGPFPHFGTFAFYTKEYSLYRCPECGSLIYHPSFTPKIQNTDSEPESVTGFAFGTRYHLEIGYSVDHIVWCAMVALAGLPEAERERHLFVDIGAGVGLSSAFVRQHTGMETLTVEPSPSGKVGAELFDLPVHRAMIEDLPPEVLAELRRRPTLLHLNSVVEHIAHPATALRAIMALTDVSAIGIVVPDGGAISHDAPFLQQLPLLAPGDHMHLPTEEGVRRLFQRLGLPAVQSQAGSGLIVATAARQPFALPSREQTDAARDTFLEWLSHNPDRRVSEGALVRMLPYAVLRPDSEAVAAIRARIGDRFVPEPLMRHLAEDPNWDNIPIYAGIGAFWMATDAFRIGHLREGERWLNLLEVFAQRMARDYQPYAATTLYFRTEGRLTRAQAMMDQRRWDEARSCLETVLDSASDHQLGATAPQLERARGLRSQLPILTEPPTLREALRLWARGRFSR